MAQLEGLPIADAGGDAALGTEEELSRVQAAAARVPDELATQVHHTRSSSSLRVNPNPSMLLSVSLGWAFAVHTKSRNRRLRRLTQRLTQQMKAVENEVHQELAVLDAETGKMLNYRQLMRHPTYKKSWQLSSANEFG